MNPHQPYQVVSTHVQYTELNTDSVQDSNA